MSIIERHSRVRLYYRLGLTDDQILEDNFDAEPMTLQLVLFQCDGGRS